MNGLFQLIYWFGILPVVLHFNGENGDMQRWAEALGEALRISFLSVKKINNSTD